MRIRPSVLLLAAGTLLTGGSTPGQVTTAGQEMEQVVVVGKIHEILATGGLDKELVIPASQFRLPAEKAPAWDRKAGTFGIKKLDVDESLGQRPYIVLTAPGQADELKIRLRQRGNFVVDDIPRWTDEILPKGEKPRGLGEGPCTQCYPAAPGLNGGVAPKPTPLSSPLLPAAGPAFAAKMEQCQSGARAVREKAQHKPQCFQPGFNPDRPCDAPVDAAASLAAYSNACLLPSSWLEKELRFQKQLGALAFLMRKGEDQPFCGALLLDASTALTAAHCFEVERATDARLRTWARPDLELEFTLDQTAPDWAGPLRERPLKLRLKAPVAGYEPRRICFDDPQPLELLDLIGSFPIPATSWRDRLSTGVFACSAVGLDGMPLAQRRYEKRCYRHGCQAFGGFSGTPLFGSDPAPAGCDLRVVGMHVSGGGGSGDSCAASDANSALAGSLLADFVGPAAPRVSEVR